jgi:hypothetical protein
VSRQRDNIISKEWRGHMVFGPIHRSPVIKYKKNFDIKYGWKVLSMNMMLKNRNEQLSLNAV